MANIEIGTKFNKQLPKGKMAECELVDIVQRVSTVTGEIISLEYFAKCDSMHGGKSFEVAKNTILRGKL